MSYRQIGRFRTLSIGVMLWIMSASVFSATQVDDLLATLSNAKAELEGRATRIQNCSGLRASKNLEVLISQFEDARNPFNSRLDAWIFVLKTEPLKPIEETLEARKLSEAFHKAAAFKEAADQALKKGPCSQRVALWKEAIIASIPLVVPPIAEGLKKLFNQAGADQKMRDELIKALDQKKVAAWRGISVYVVYDWSTEEIISPEKVNEAVLRKASTSVYVNKWALRTEPGPQLVVDKLPPDELPAYMLYTGKIKDLNRYVGTPDSPK